MPKQKRPTCVVTWLGLFLIALSAIDFFYVIVHQYAATGAFFAGDAGWVSPRYARIAMLTGFAVSVGVLIIGAVIDTLLARRHD